MNLSIHKITAGVGLLLSLGAISCQENSVVSPDKPAAVASETTNAADLPILQKGYVLTRHGQATLTYYPDGRVKRVMDDPDGRSNPGYRREYTYDDVAHRIDVSTYKGTKMILFDMYFIDELTGLCHQSEQVDYTILDDPNNTHVQLNTRWLYQYTAKGQLKICQNLFLHSSDRTEYIYNADDDLIKTVTYDRVGSQDGVLIHELILSYGQLSRGAIAVDKYPLNASWMNLPVPSQSIKGQPVPDHYLPIFGKPSKHLVTSVTQMKLTGIRYTNGASFTYRLNPDGYVTERKEYNQRGGTLTGIKPYTYGLSTIFL